jgi:hypothetical protein
MASWKDTCRAATTANITLSGTQTIDGVALAVGDRVLVKDQTSAANHGIYTVASGAWSRASDANTAGLISGMIVRIGPEGSANPSTIWLLQAADPITLGTTSLTYLMQLRTAPVSNIAALKTTIGAAPLEIVHVGCYTSTGDGGGGEFYWDGSSSATDDGGIVIQPTGLGTGRWMRLFDGPVRSEWFGILADGSNEETKLRAAIAAAQTRNRALVLSGGAIGIGGAIALSSGTRISSQVGTKTTIRQLTTVADNAAGIATADCFLLTGVSDVTLSDLIIEAPNSGGLTVRDHTGVWIRDCGKITIRGCTFRYWSSAVRAWGNVTNCDFNENCFENPLVAAAQGGTPDVGVIITYTADAATDVFTTANPHGFVTDQWVMLFNSGGAAPAGVTTGVMYYARDVTSTTFKLAATRGGAAINITTNGTGTNTTGDGLLHHNVTLDLVGPPLPTKYNHISGVTIQGCHWFQSGALVANVNQSRGLNIGTSTQGVIVDSCSWVGWKHNALIFAGGAPITGFFTCRGHQITGCTWDSIPAGTGRAIFFFNGAEDIVVNGFYMNDIAGDAIEILNSQGIKICNGTMSKCGYNHDDTGSNDTYETGITVARTPRLGGIRISSSVIQVEESITIENVKLDRMANYGIVLNGYEIFLKVRGLQLKQIGLPEVVGDDNWGVGIWGVGQSGTRVHRYCSFRDITTFQTGGEAIVIGGDFRDVEILDVRVYNASQRHRSQLSVQSTADVGGVIRLYLGAHHNLKTGDRVDVAGVHANANGNRVVTIVNMNVIDLQGTTPIGSSLGPGGTVSPYFTVTGCTGNGVQVVLTTGTAHGRASGDWIFVSGVGGNTAANGHYKCGVVTSTTIALTDKDGNAIIGNGTYTSGGRVSEETDAVLIGESTTIADGAIAAAPLSARLDNVVVDDSPGIALSTRGAIRLIGTVTDVRMVGCSGFGTKKAAAGASIDVGSNDVYRRESESGATYKPVYSQYQSLVMGANGLASYGAVALDQAAATSGALAGSKVSPDFGSQTVKSTVARFTTGVKLGADAAPSFTLDVTGSARISQDALFRGDGTGAAFSWGNTWTVNADTGIFRDVATTTPHFDWDNGTNFNLHLPNWNFNQTKHFQFGQTTRTTDAGTNSFTWRPQKAFATATGANRNGGTFDVILPDATNSGTVHGQFQVFNEDASKTMIKVGKNSGGTVTVEIGHAADTSTLQTRINGKTSAGASTGSNGAPPAQVDGYLSISVNGTEKKIPYYAV